MNKKNILISAITIILLSASVGGYFLYKSYIETEDVTNTLNNNRAVLREVASKFDESANKTLDLNTDSDLAVTQVAFEKLGVEMNSLTSYIKETSKIKIQKGSNKDTEELYADYQNILDKLSGISDKYAVFSNEIACYSKYGIQADTTLSESNTALESLNNAKTVPEVAVANDKVGEVFDKVSSLFKLQRNCFSTDEAKEIFAKADKDIFKGDFEITFKNLASAFYGVGAGVRENDIQKVQSFNQLIQNITSAPKVSPEEQFKEVISLYTKEFASLSKEFVLVTNDLSFKVNKLAAKYGLTFEK